MFSENDNQVTARVGFTIEETQLQGIQAQLDKINTASSSLASSFSNVEKALQQLNNLTTNSNSSISSNVQKTNNEIREEAKRTTMELKAQLDQRTRDDRQAKALELNEIRSLANSIRAEESKEVATHKANEQIRVAETRSALRNMEREERNTINQRNSLQRQSVKEATQQFNLMASQYRSAINSMKNDYESFSNITTMGTSNSSQAGVFGKQLSYAVLQVTGVRTLLNQFATVSKDIVEINKNTINVQRIMGETTSETSEKLTESAFKIASATSTIVTDIQEIQSSWVRINDAYANDLNLLEQITDKTAKFINVGEITDAEEAVSLLNSSILQFRMYTSNSDGSLNIDMDEVEATLNKWAYMADKTAMGTADEFGESLSKIGGQMELLGGDIDDAIVMTSILGDRLAKTGDEAGNSLKTITAYLTRDKTLGLFADLGLETDEFNNSLMQTNTKFEEFSIIMENLSGAYNQAIAEGNDVVAKAIQNAIGATRQGDASVALLKNWAEDSAKYYAMIEEAEQSSYLDDQNEKLMQSFSAQWNSLSTAITNFANAIATSGLLNDIQSIMNVLTSFFDNLSNINEGVLSFVSKITELSVAFVGLKKVLQMVGVWDNFKANFQYGTIAVREQAEELMKHKLAVLEDQQAEIALGKTKSQYLTDSNYRQTINEQQQLITNQTLALQELNAKYKEGSITAQQYMEAVNKLVVAERQETVATESDTQANITHIQTVREEVNVTLQEINAQTSKTSLFLTKLTTGLKAVGSSLVSSLTSPLTIITLLGTAISFVVGKINNVKEEAKNRLDNLNSELQTTKSELDSLKSELDEVNGEIRDLKSQGTLTFVEQEELEKLKESREELSASYELKKKLAIESEKEKAQILSKEIKKSNISKVSEILSDREAYQNGEEMNLADLRREKGLDAYNFITGNGDATFLLQEVEELQGLLDELNSFEYYDIVDNENLFQAKTTLEDLLIDINNLVLTDEERFDNLISSEDFEESKKQILELASTGKLTVDDLSGFEEINQYIADTGVSAEQLVREFNALVGVEEILDPTDVTEFTQGLADAMEDITSIDEDIKGIINNELTETDMTDLITRYEGFYEVSNKSVKEQIEWLQNYKNEKQDAYNTSLDEQENQLLEERKTLLQQISSLYNSKGEVIDTEALITAKENLEIVEDNLKKISAYQKIKIDFDLDGVVEQLGDITEGIDDLVTAQNKLAQGTALNKAELWDLVLAYPELLYQADLFNTTEASNQKNLIDAISNMKEEEYDNNIDLMIANLKAKTEEANNELEIERLKEKTLNKITFISRRNDGDYSRQLAELIADYENQTVANHKLTQQEIVDTNSDSVQKQEEQHTWLGNAIASFLNKTKQNKVDSEDQGNTDALVSADSFLKKYSTGVAGRMSSLFGSIASKFKNAITGKSNTKVEGTGGLTTGTTVKTNSGTQVAFDGTNYTVDDEILGTWVENQRKIVESTINELAGAKQGYINAINNLETLKGMSISEVSNNYGGNSPYRDTSSSSKSSSDDTLDSLVSAIESFQDRLVKALKEKYQELYDARVELLEKEKEQQIQTHNERIEQLQAEIDKLNGETIEDKESDLSKLKKQYNEWLKDDSSTGKAKQKELKDKIEDLETEIAIDKLEEQIDDEQACIESINDKFDELLNEDSENFDSELKALNKKMEDEQLYNEVNNLIRNEQLSTIIDLITTYDPDYSGIAGLMGQTIGQVVGNEVATAMANWQTYKNGGTTVATTDNSTSSLSSSSTTSSSASAKAIVTIKKNDSLWKLAQQYYGDGSQWTKIQNANNGISPSSLQIGQQIVIPFSTGGYTGNDEGLAYLHRKERVLTSEQTLNFDKLVNSYLPTIDSKLVDLNKTSNTINNRNVEFNKELVSINIDKVVNNTQADIDNANDNLDRMFRHSLQKSGINFNK